MRARLGLAAILALLAGCGVPVAPPQRTDLAAEAIPGDPGIPPSAEGCWGRDTLPAVIETETVTRELADGSYRSESRQKMVQDRQTVWIRTPCRDQLTPETVLTLQRALRARGYYLGALDGGLTDETMVAIRRWQADNGLDTRVLSLKGAQSLGLVATPLRCEPMDPTLGRKEGCAGGGDF